jgi:thiol-disulfide isomerase/thioredoxin
MLASTTFLSLSIIEYSYQNILRLSIWIALFFTFSPLLTLADALNDIKAVPHIDSAGQDGYRNFLAADKHRAFAIAPGGAWSWKGGEASAKSASATALQSCQNDSDLSCVLYALDDKVVFDTRVWARLWGPYLNHAEAGAVLTGLNRGQRFYNLTFKNAAGKSISLSDLQGKVVLLHFWGSWCPPCRSEIPELQKLYQALGAASDVQLVLLQVQEDFDVSRQWARQQHLILPLFDSGVKSKAMGSLTLADGKQINDRDIAPAFPTTYILDKHGVVVFSNIGPVARWPQYLPQLRDVAARSGK